MKCPYCMIGFKATALRIRVGYESDWYWYQIAVNCPDCEKLIVYFQKSRSELPIPASQQDIERLMNLTSSVDVKKKKELSELYGPDHVIDFLHVDNILVKPRASMRPPCPPEVDNDKIVEDYKEACLVLPDSPKASAALSRRCLQNLLRKKAKVKPDKLYKEIQEAIEGLPSYLAGEIDDIRKFGNIAAHPVESKSTGEIVPV